jgi:hypothetical protein
MRARSEMFMVVLLCGILTSGGTSAYVQAMNGSSESEPDIPIVGNAQPGGPVFQRDALFSLHSDVSHPKSDVKAAFTTLELGSTCMLILRLLVLFALLTVLLMAVTRLIKESLQALARGLRNGLAKLLSVLGSFAGLPWNDAGESGMTRPAGESHSTPIQRILSEYQPPRCACAPEMISVTTSVLTQLQHKTRAAEQKRPGNEVGFGLVGHASGNWQQLRIGGLLNPGDNARYSPCSIHEDLDAQSAELKRYQFLDPRGVSGLCASSPWDYENT